MKVHNLPASSIVQSQIEELKSETKKKKTVFVLIKIMVFIFSLTIIIPINKI